MNRCRQHTHFAPLPSLCWSRARRRDSGAPECRAALGQGARRGRARGAGAAGGGRGGGRARRGGRAPARRRRAAGRTRAAARRAAGCPSRPCPRRSPRRDPAQEGCVTRVLGCCRACSSRCCPACLARVAVQGPAWEELCSAGRACDAGVAAGGRAPGCRGHPCSCGGMLGRASSASGAAQQHFTRALRTCNLQTEPDAHAGAACSVRHGRGVGGRHGVRGAAPAARRARTRARRHRGCAQGHAAETAPAGRPSGRRGRRRRRRRRRGAPRARGVCCAR